VSDQCWTFIDTDNKRFSSDCHGSFVAGVKMAAAKVQKFGAKHELLKRAAEDAQPFPRLVCIPEESHHSPAR
jgi:hypothetical protein